MPPAWPSICLRWSLLLLFGQYAKAGVLPLFYIYKLPPQLQILENDKHYDRNTGHYFEASLRRTNQVTHIPLLADYFLVPSYPMGAHESYATFRSVLEHVKYVYPYWNSTSGANHVVVGSWDFGLMQLAGLQDFRRIVHVHHFGWINASRPWQVTVDGRCRFHSGDACSTLTGHLGPDYGTHRANQDIIVPDMFESVLKVRKSPVPRTTKVFFAGSPTNIYRDDVFEMYSNVSGWRIVKGRVQLDDELAKSVFCLDLGAGGFSTRFTHAMIQDCVPVWIDELLPPWSGVLPIDTFSVKFAVSDLPNLRSVIDSITPERTAELQANVRKHSAYYHWSHIFGATHEAPYPDAFDLFMQVLESRKPPKWSRKEPK
jgi:hypothetical protein